MRPFFFRFSVLVLAIYGAVPSQAAVTVGRSIGAARITQIANPSAADLVVIDAGFEAGFRQGMVCTVTRSGENIGELLLVDIRPRIASALILALPSGRSFQPGDTVAVKTVSSRK